MADTHFAVALHTLAALALSGGERVTSRDLAGSVRTSDAFVRRVLGALREAGIIASEEGAAGGVRLSRPADEVSLSAVYRALAKAPLLRPAASVPNLACPVGGHITPVVADLFAEAESALVARLDTLTVADLVERIAHRHELLASGLATAATEQT